MKSSVLVTVVAAGYVVIRARDNGKLQALTNGAVQADSSENVGGTALGLTVQGARTDTGRSAATATRGSAAWVATSVTWARWWGACWAG